jgi:hypothetical protein
LLRTACLFGALALAAFCCLPAMAQSPQSTTVAPVGVTAGDPAEKFVSSYAALTPIDQLATWRAGEGVCPQAYGVPNEVGAQVTQRLLAIASLVDAPVRRTPCEPNVMIVFTLHAQEQVDQILATQPARFGLLKPGGSKPSVTMTNPVQAWYVTETVDWSGRARRDDNTLGGKTFNLRTGRSTEGGVDGRAGSRLGEGLESHFVSVLIVIDGAKVDIDPNGPITDYIAMLALAQTKNFAQCHGLPSVANLAAPYCSAGATMRLAGADIAYLRGLYAVRMTDKASLQKDEIAKRITRDAPH